MVINQFKLVITIYAFAIERVLFAAWDFNETLVAYQDVHLDAFNAYPLIIVLRTARLFLETLLVDKRILVLAQLTVAIVTIILAVVDFGEALPAD